MDTFKDPETSIRDAGWSAIFAITCDQTNGQFRPEYSAVMLPHLTALLADPKTDALRVISLLSKIGPAARPALPAILPFLNNETPNLRIAATEARAAD